MSDGEAVTIALPGPLARRLDGWIARVNRQAPELALDRERAMLVLLDEALERAELSGVVVEEIRARLEDAVSGEPV